MIIHTHQQKKADLCQWQECELDVPVYLLYQEALRWLPDHFHQWRTDHQGQCICRLHICTAKHTTNFTHITAIYINNIDNAFINFTSWCFLNYITV